MVPFQDSICRAVGVLVIGSIGCATIQAAEPATTRWPVTAAQRGTADEVARLGVALSELAPNAPDAHTVKRGDTLWAISGLFLRSPWRWPELWGMNREQIRNPHLIYPGQVLRLIRKDGRAWLQLGNTETDGPMKLSPRVRDLGPQSEAIWSIPAKVIEPFLARPLVVTADELDQYPRIVATQEGRLHLGRGDYAYARGVTDPRATAYNVFRPARPLFDPDDTERKTPIAYEAFYLGVARLTRLGDDAADVATLRIDESVQEIGVSDRLVPIAAQPFLAYVPHAPDAPMDGRVISIYSGVNQAGTQSVVALNRGAQDGMEVGHVVSLLDAGATVRDRTDPARPLIKLPDERIGEMFVFRVSPTISYGLIMRVTKPVKVGDRFVNPESSAQYSR
jgi:LysM repeat protein